MRNRIVHVEQVQRVDFRDFCHARGQSEIVWRILKKRILRDDHFMKVNSRMVFNEADRLGIGDEVDVVSALGELNTQLRRDDSAATVCGITGDTYLHKCSYVLSIRCYRGMKDSVKALRS